MPRSTFLLLVLTFALAFAFLDASFASSAPDAGQLAADASGAAAGQPLPSPIDSPGEFVNQLAKAAQQGSWLIVLALVVNGLTAILRTKRALRFLPDWFETQWGGYALVGLIGLGTMGSIQLYASSFDLVSLVMSTIMPVAAAIGFHTGEQDVAAARSGNAPPPPPSGS